MKPAASIRTLSAFAFGLAAPADAMDRAAAAFLKRHLIVGREASRHGASLSPPQPFEPPETGPVRATTNK